MSGSRIRSSFVGAIKFSIDFGTLTLTIASLTRNPNDDEFNTLVEPTKTF